MQSTTFPVENLPNCNPLPPPRREKRRGEKFALAFPFSRGAGMGDDASLPSSAKPSSHFHVARVLDSSRARDSLIFMQRLRAVAGHGSRQGNVFRAWFFSSKNVRHRPCSKAAFRVYGPGLSLKFRREGKRGEGPLVGPRSSPFYTFPPLDTVPAHLTLDRDDTKRIARVTNRTRTRVAGNRQDNAGRFFRYRW